MREAIDDRISAIEREKAKAKAKAARLEKIASRFKAARGKPNILREMVVAKVRVAKSTLASADTSLASIRLARELLDGLSFEAEEEEVERVMMRFAMRTNVFAGASTTA